MIIKNATLRNKTGLWDIFITDKIITSISPANEEMQADDVLDVAGSFVLPPFIEPHIHLDTTLTAGEPQWNESGTLFEGIQRWSERKQSLTYEDVKKRAVKALKWQIAQGIQHVRTHVDVTDPKLTALRALLEVKEEMAKYVDLQLVAFPQEGVLSYPNGKELLEEALKLGADVVGGIPHFEFTREYGVDSLRTVFDLAEKYDRLVDIHCDEIDDEQSRFIEVVAKEAYERGLGSRVTASHTTAMGSYNDAYTYKLFRLLEISEINFVSNPLVNIHLQGRFDTYPKRRGLTRVKELLEAGMNVCFGHDDIFDPWYPLGTGNMLQVLHMGIHASQLLGYEQIVNSIDLITTNSAKTLNLEQEYGIEVGKPANLIVLDAENEYEAIRKQAVVTHSIRNGNMITKTTPSKTKINLGIEEHIHFTR
ncbi:cytosine deaminase [Virgibacillus pantothenticus]|uniref:Cytosine deaminase n=1 Tax=Virgibacillus pantothenticus TaxID=1473 RepID=A0A0L0QLU6_VIRPA|nr:cytosine deaminase [Virgibacillus pantothenticus]KNE19516.1 cytosine deaminase [Virgibacillus pantothenticus]MBU8565753.1 cytosine deaminase [Virgibacillus pantothenticus]MBU8599660.1 cytosine deaminase [Virgibacillus pantothenticus]MBU8634107.1 cytosine deaminase [Virgibacillus pantothenticus]MBU8642148.1 cytosine deaminase [Virgibacillus pantothenticus]